MTDVKMVYICLCMIVKNESNIIQRCLDAVLPIIDALCITDTGSTDNTKELVAEWATKHNLPYSIPERPFDNFADSRTASYRNAIEAFPETDYMLLVDADMILRIEEEFDKESLTATCYNIPQVSGIKWYNPRLLKTDIDWVCRGATHEFWSGDDINHRTKMDTLWIDDRGDGGCKDDKTERDIRLLTEEINNPETSDDLVKRDLFYLGNSYKDAKEYVKAIGAFRRYLKYPHTWNEERFYSKLQIARCYEGLEREEETVGAYLKAIAERHIRGEAYWGLAWYFMNRYQHAVAMQYILMALRNIPDEQDDILFVDAQSNSRLQYIYLLTICAFYVKQIPMGRYLSDYLLTHSDVCEHHKESVVQNICYYLPCLREYASFECNDLLAKLNYKPPVDNKWALLNPSLSPRSQGGYWLNIRMVNYRIANPRYICMDDDGVIRTLNLLLAVSSDWQVEQSYFLEGIYTPGHQYIEGIEDVRILEVDSTIYFTCVQWVDNEFPRIFWGELSELDNRTPEEPSTKRVEVKLLITPEETEKLLGAEKNWTPISSHEVLYKASPAITLDVSQAKHSKLNERKVNTSYLVNKEETDESELMVDIARGGSSPVAYQDGWLTVIHEVCINGGKRYYYHRFVQYDKDWNIIAVSPSFYFIHKGIEFASGMVWDESGEKLHVVLGYEDKKAYMVTLEKSSLNKLLWNADKFKEVASMIINQYTRINL
jgi:glycosyltransferase involved in cell wall biosynthesis